SFKHLLVDELCRDRPAYEVAAFAGAIVGAIGGEGRERIPERAAIDAAVLIRASLAKAEHGLEIVQRIAAEIGAIDQPRVLGPDEGWTDEREQGGFVFGGRGLGQRIAAGNRST